MLALVAPITSRIRGHAFEVLLNGGGAGAILCLQVKMIDFSSRGVQHAEKAPSFVTSDVLAKVRAIVNE